MIDKNLTLTVLHQKFAVCKADCEDVVPAWTKGSEFYSITKTLDEFSVVCCQDRIPVNISQERDWRVLKIEGALEFSLIGILSSISSILAQEGISIFAISTYNTDYILVKDQDLKKAVAALTDKGYIIKA